MITMIDVARKAGVSQATASLVLNNRDTELRISDSTRQRVLETAREMGYRRNALARAVGSGKNFVLGYLKMDTGEQELSILEGVLKAASEAGYLLKVLPRNDREGYQDVVKHCVEQRLAGLVTRSFLDGKVTNAFCEEMDHSKIPVVFVDDNLAMPGTTCVTSDDDLGYRLTVSHLAELGHTRIAFIAGDSIHPQSILRKESYRKVMAEHELPTPEGSILDSNWNFDRTEYLTRQLYQDRLQYPTALVCAGDMLAAVAIRTLSKLGLRVPEDVSVVGYSDFSFATLLNPALTTISQPFEEMGIVATRILLQRLKEPSDVRTIPTQMVLPTELIVRDSTAVCPQDRVASYHGQSVALNGRNY